MSSHPLFSTFPREVLALARPNEFGNRIATRSVILSQKELDLFIQKFSGVQDPFVGSFIYKGDVGSTTVDKLPFDFDDEHKGYAFKFAEWLYENKIGYVAIGTYFDRYHIYIPVYPQKLTPLELQESQLSLLEQAGVYEEVENGNGKYYQPMSDVHIIGDIRRVMRIPNTPRLPKKEGGEIISYCTYLPQNFYDMDKTLLYSILKHPNDMETPDFFPRPLYEIVKPLTRQFRNIVKNTTNKGHNSVEYTPTDPLLQFVQSILRPCIFSSLVSPNPPHFIRVAATIDLRELGLSHMEIFDIFSRLDWIDWNADTCDYQVSDVMGKEQLNPYSCTKIRNAGVPCIDGCKYKTSSYSWMIAKR